MHSIKSKNTQLENRFYKMLLEKSIEEIEQYPKEVFGKPDFVIRKSKIAIFVDSCFWHGCPEHCRMPKSNIEYWEKKIRRNKMRDELVGNELRKLGWTVFRLWEHSLSSEPELKSLTEKFLKVKAKNRT